MTQTFKKGFLIGGGLIIVGLALEMSVGPVVWEAFAWPVNGIVMAGFLAVVAVLFLLRKKVPAFQFVGTCHAAIPAMVCAVVLTIVMGLTRQTASPTGGESHWFNHMLTFWPFVLIYVYVATILGVITLRRLTHLTSWKRDVPFLLNHFGLFLALTTATLGNADMQRVKMVTVVGEPEWRAVTQNGGLKEMPLTIELKKFIMETYDDGSPKRYASDILIQTMSGRPSTNGRLHAEDGETVEAVVDVNKPYEVDGWKIYQYGYDVQMGAMSQTSVLELVSDPWLPLVYAGIYMMLAGAVCMFVFGGRKRDKEKLDR